MQSPSPCGGPRPAHLGVAALVLGQLPVQLLHGSAHLRRTRRAGKAARPTLRQDGGGVPPPAPARPPAAARPYSRTERRRRSTKAPTGCNGGGRPWPEQARAVCLARPCNAPSQQPLPRAPPHTHTHLLRLVLAGVELSRERLEPLAQRRGLGLRRRLLVHRGARRLAGAGRLRPQRVLHALQLGQRARRRLGRDALVVLCRRHAHTHAHARSARSVALQPLPPPWARSTRFRLRVFGGGGGGGGAGLLCVCVCVCVCGGGRGAGEGAPGGTGGRRLAARGPSRAAPPSAAETEPWTGAPRPPAHADVSAKHATQGTACDSGSAPGPPAPPPRQAGDDRSSCSGGGGGGGGGGGRGGGGGGGGGGCGVRRARERWCAHLRGGRVVLQSRRHGGVLLRQREGLRRLAAQLRVQALDLLVQLALLTHQQVVLLHTPWCRLPRHATPHKMLAQHDGRRFARDHRRRRLRREGEEARAAERVVRACKRAPGGAGQSPRGAARRSCRGG